MAQIQPGDQAPDVTLTTQSGETFALRDFRGQKVVVLFFYPKDNTSICTAQACAFRDSYEQFVEAGAVVIGISSDSDESHRGFAQKHRLPFHLVSDVDGALRKAFGVPKTLGLLPGRVTYVIDREGIVRLAFSAQLVADGHVKQAMDAVKQWSV